MRWLLWWRPPCLLRLVIINLTGENNSAIQGVLWSSRGSWLVLRDAKLLATGTPPSAIDGEVVIHRSRVAFIQVLP